MSENGLVHILCMEDDQVVARLVQMRLEQAGCTVEVARDGEEGLTRYAADRHDIVIVDQEMPGYTGLDVIRALAARGALPPTIMVTAMGSEQLAVTAMKLGARDYLIKDLAGTYLDLLPAIVARVLHEQQLIREREAALAALQRSEERYRTIFETTGTATIIVADDGMISLANAEFEQLTGYPRAALEGRRRWTEFLWTEFPATDDVETAREIQRSLRLGLGVTARSREIRFRSRQGAFRELFAITATIPHTSTHVISLLDITERKQIEEALQARNEELDAFAHTVAHDLQNSVTAVQGYAMMLEEMYARLTAEEVTHHIHKVATSARKMGTIISELMLLAGLHTANVPRGPLDMGTVVTEALQRLEHMIEAYQAEIVLPDAWPAAVGYGPWIEEVWVNYISNAIKYGGTPPRVELGADLLSGSAEVGAAINFWVRDNGAGLMPEAQAKLFTPFTRLGQVDLKGHGLGLSIVRRIVRKLGGQVGVESAVGQGSAFSFTLPAVTAGVAVGAGG